MKENSDFHSVEFFRSVRDKHAELLSGMHPDQIVAFFQSQEEPNNGATSDRGLAGLRSRSGQQAHGGVR
ncbi:MULTISPECIES: hypothetical protein [unclassified Thiocapsa]|uniref:hypothetical protein n=2 Tax=Thiocapsa TaxID=1056 RepID=UPI0035AF5D5D